MCCGDFMNVLKREIANRFEATAGRDGQTLNFSLALHNDDARVGASLAKVRRLGFKSRASGEGGFTEFIRGKTDGRGKKIITVRLRKNPRSDSHAISITSSKARLSQNERKTVIALLSAIKR